MTPAQMKLFAIRALVNGVWDHPALAFFGPIPTDQAQSILHILDADVDPQDAVAVSYEMDGYHD